MASRLVLLALPLLLLVSSSSAVTIDQAIGPIRSVTYGDDWGTAPLDYFKWEVSSYDDSHGFFAPFLVPVDNGGVLELTPANMSQEIPADSSDLTPYRELLYNGAAADELLANIAVQVMLLIPDEVELKNGSIYTQADAVEYLMGDFIPNFMLAIGDVADATFTVGENFYNFEASSEDYFFFLTYFTNGVLYELLFEDIEADEIFYIGYTGESLTAESEFSPFEETHDDTHDDSSATSEPQDDSPDFDVPFYPALSALAIPALIRRRKN